MGKYTPEDCKSKNNKADFHDELQISVNGEFLYHKRRRINNTWRKAKT